MTRISDDSATTRLVQQAAAGDQQAWQTLILRHRDRLRNMVALRMDRRLQGRMDPSDVIQDACLVAAKQLSTYASDPSMSFYLWLRWITGNRLVDQHRRHLGTRARSVSRELSLYHGASPGATTADLATHMLGRLSTPSKSAMRIEEKIRLEEALNSLDPIDREILALRHFEELTNGETAEWLGLDKSAASKRYARALRRLRDVLIPTLGPDRDQLRD